MRHRPTLIRAHRGALALLCGALLGATLAQAQSNPELPQPSPKARVQQRVGLTDFAVDYSSPGVKGREIWGGLVPLDELWRTGANAATKFEASRDFMFGGKKVPAGTYALLTIPGRESWTVILNTDTNLPGTRGYEKKKDVVRITVKPEPAPHRERLAFLFTDTTDDSSRLDLEWERLRVSVPLLVDTATHARANMDKALDEAWRPHLASARYLLDTGGDLGQALTYADTSIAIKPTWWNHWVKAQIVAKQGRPADAVAIAEQANRLGKGDPIFEGFFKEQVSRSIADWKKPS
jgi:hypothetical protein